MTQPPRTTESISRDNAAIRDIMHQIRELTVPDRATLALGLIGHLATMMNRGQMTKLMAELQEEAEKVQDVPPARQRDNDRARAAEDAAGGSTAGGGAAGGRSAGGAAARGGESVQGRDDRGAGAVQASGARSEPANGESRGIGQAGRGEFRTGRLV
jgi:hypothetical protein